MASGEIKAPRRPRADLRATGLALALLVQPGLVSAEERVGSQPAPTQRAPYSDFEAEIIAQILAARDYEAEPAPEGKRIESIEIVTLEVWDHRDPVPNVANLAHSTTRPSVINWELLFNEGDVYHQALVDESARNLRLAPQLSVVLIIAARGTTRDSVRVIVITKDIWSLRLNWDIEWSDEGLSRFYFNPSEWNVLGTHFVVGGLYILEPDTFSLGALAFHQRLLGGRLQVELGVGSIFNRRDGEREGSFGSVLVGQPLYATSVHWGWQMDARWLDETTRRFSGLTEDVYDGQRGVSDGLCTADASCIPYQYSTHHWVSRLELLRSFGRVLKYNLSGGIEADRRKFGLASLADGNYDPAVLAAFERSEVPTSDTRLSPFVQLEAYSARYLRTLDLETLGLQEDVRLGHRAIVKLYPASSAFASTRDLLGSYAGLSYTLALGDGLLRAMGSSTIEYEFSGRHDAMVQAGLRVATPRLGFGRIIYDGTLAGRYENQLNRHFTLGGESRPRGYPTSSLFGDHIVAHSIEYRTSSFELLSAQVGGALFFDAAAASQSFASFDLKQSAGGGLRIQFPQFDRAVFRADWGYPFDPEESTPLGAVFVTFGQAFDLAELEPRPEQLVVF